MNKLAILDLMNLAHRTYHFFKEMEGNGMVHGARLFMSDVINKIKPTHLLVVTDAPGDTFRHEIFSDYKANRGPKEPGFIDQLSGLYKMFDCMGINIVECKGYEADDLVGSAVESFKDKGEIVILSGDKDFMQLLIYPNVTLGWTDKAPIGRTGVQEKLNVDPGQVIDYLSLRGDSSDNIPGVKGVGPKKASQLLKQYGTLDNIYHNLHLIKGKALKENLIKSQDNAYLSRALVGIYRNIDLGLSFDELKVDSSCLKTPSVIDLYSNLGLKTGTSVL